MRITEQPPNTTLEPTREDQYDSYIAPVYRILAGSRSEQELVEYLHRTARDTIGIATDTTGHLEFGRPIARRLLQLNVRL